MGLPVCSPLSFLSLTLIKAWSHLLEEASTPVEHAARAKEQEAEGKLLNCRNEFFPHLYHLLSEQYSRHLLYIKTLVDPENQHIPNKVKKIRIKGSILSQQEGWPRFPALLRGTATCPYSTSVVFELLCVCFQSAQLCFRFW